MHFLFTTQHVNNIEKRRYRCKNSIRTHGTRKKETLTDPHGSSECICHAMNKLTQSAALFRKLVIVGIKTKADTE